VSRFDTIVARLSPGVAGAPEVPSFARERFRKPVRELRVTDVYDPHSGWRKAPRGTMFCAVVASDLLGQGVTQVRLQSGREKHDVSILQPKGGVARAEDSEFRWGLSEWPTQTFR